MTMPPCVLISGANGFVGSGLCREGLRRGWRVLALVRPGANRELIPPGAEIVHGDFTQRDCLANLPDDARPRALIHAAAVVSTGVPNLETSLRINVEGTRNLQLSAHSAGVTRWIQISSMSAHPTNMAVYGGTKYLADLVVRNGPIPWTILRPSLVYGPQARGLFHRMVTLLERLPIVPMLGSGEEPMRPVHVDDVARAAFRALERPEAIGESYCLGGPEDWNFADLLTAIAASRGKQPFLIPIPMPLCRLMALVGELLLPMPPVTSDNLEGISKAQAVDISAAARDLDFAPRPFDPRT